MELLNMYFFPSSTHFIPLKSKYLPRHSVLKQLCVHPLPVHRFLSLKTRKIIVYCILILMELLNM
jgi:hypothetical protein